jgi:signal transduction histidine kinase
VKAKKTAIKKISMRTVVSPDYLNCQANRDLEDQNRSGELLNHVIENAGGVPYQLLFGNLPGDGIYQCTCQGLLPLIGINPGEFTERLFMQMIEEIVPLSDDIPLDITGLREKLMAGEIRKYNAEILVITPSGDRKWLRDSSISVTDEKTGKVTGMTGVFFDINDQKLMHLQLENAMERATESDRLKTAFLNNLSHEIRTPLNAIVGFSTLLGEPGQVPGSRMEFMDIITHSSDHLLEIIDDVLEISKIETGSVRIIKKEVNLNQLMQRVYDRFKPAALEKNVTLRYNEAPQGRDVIITTDGYKLFQSVTNLMSNAVKFTFEGKVEFGFLIKSGVIEFYVIDTGIGIGTEHQPHIFKPFYQAESSSIKRYEGTGLGLSIAKAYIELLGGTIWFNSDYGKGSVFCFSIPDTRIIRE